MTTEQIVEEVHRRIPWTAREKRFYKNGSKLVWSFGDAGVTAQEMNGELVVIESWMGLNQDATAHQFYRARVLDTYEEVDGQRYYQRSEVV